jgi:hypothetical protein
MSEVVSVSVGLAWTRAVLRQWGVWTRSHLLMTFVLSALAFLIGWVLNTYLMAFVLEGSTVGPDTDTAATADERTANGLFWLLLFTLLAGLLTYAWSRGWKDFRTDLATLPRLFVEAMTRGRTGAIAMVLWGAAVGLVVSTLISSAVALALGLVLLALAATPVGIILNFAIIRIWRGLCGVIAPVAGPQVAATVSPFMVMLGEALGLFLDWMIGVWTVGLLLGVVSAVVSLLLVRGTPPRGATVAILAGAVVVWGVVRARWAYADDGGWGECGEPCSGLGGIFAWAGSDGAGYVMARAAIGGVFSAAGAALGGGIGGATAGIAGAAAGIARPSSGQAGRTPQGPSDGRTPAPDPGESNGRPDQSRNDGPMSREAQHAATESVPDESPSHPGGQAGAAAAQTVDSPSDISHGSSPSDRVSVQPSPSETTPPGDYGAADQRSHGHGNEGDEASEATVGPDTGSATADTRSELASERPGGHRPPFDVGDVLPEDPDREKDVKGEDDEREGPPTEPPPSRP